MSEVCPHSEGPIFRSQIQEIFFFVYPTLFLGHKSKKKCTALLCLSDSLSLARRCIGMFLTCRACCRVGRPECRERVEDECGN